MTESCNSVMLSVLDIEIVLLGTILIQQIINIPRSD